MGVNNHCNYIVTTIITQTPKQHVNLYYTKRSCGLKRNLTVWLVVSATDESQTIFIYNTC